ncbi:hypothetical protein KQI38_12420 [Tissierella carlieri]|uniref:hypothetical protein n=1 Tax=Tissierella carlieri TaxID=689904 RepID=UPI001C1044B8|nr:hypothetical protein [Tissierella carlieri]MBU5312841.1 hypothetical protein [Tissierella carlieri]MDU5082945.1 hypothetical protein [Bacillota bacterium]
MKIRKSYLLLLIIIATALLLAFYLYNKGTNSKMTIRKFFDEKSALYENHEDILTALFSEAGNNFEGMGVSAEEIAESTDIFLENFKPLLSKRVYDSLVASRYLIDSNLVSGKFDKSKIDIIRWEKISKDKTNAKYLVEYIEKLYSNEKIIEEYTNIFEFKLEYIDGKWIITSIYPY